MEKQMTLTRSTAMGLNGAISTPHYLASAAGLRVLQDGGKDRKSTRLNSSHQIISSRVPTRRSSDLSAGIAAGLPSIGVPPELRNASPTMGDRPPPWRSK